MKPEFPLVVMNHDFFAPKEDADRLERFLAEVAGDAKSHTWTSVTQLVWLVERAERLLAERYVPRESRVGTLVRASGPGPAKKPYRQIVSITEVNLFRASDGWYLTEAKKVKADAEKPEEFNLLVTKKARCDALTTLSDLLPTIT